MIANLDDMVSTIATEAGLRDLVEELRHHRAVVCRGGSDSARKKHTGRGKLLVRDRIDRLLDPGSPFLELSPLAAFGMYGTTTRSGGLPNVASYSANA